MLIQGAKLGKLVGDQLTITIPLHTVEELKKFKPDDLVSIEIKRSKDKRSSQQNRYIWEIISQIDQKINGYDSDEWTIYKQLLRQAKIKTLYFETTPEAKTALQQTFRLVEEHERRTSAKGIETVVFRCYFGTSKFTKEEMSSFIEALITRAYQEDIDIYQYEQVLKGNENVK